jgi:hypothetical protein
MTNRLPGYDEYLADLTDDFVEGEEEEEDEDSGKYDQDYYDDFCEDDVCDQFWSPN